MAPLIASVLGAVLSYGFQAAPAPPAVGAAADPARLAPAAFVAAARRGDENAVRKALTLDPALATATDAAGLTALDWAAIRDDWPVFRQLLAAGAPVDRVGFDGGTVLHRAAHHDRPEMIRALLDAGADVGARNQWGRTPLHVAARRGCARTARLLVERGAPLEAETNEGWTPLNVAYRSGQPDLVALLLAAGADPDHRDAAGRRPSDVAFERPAEVPLDPDRLFEYQGRFKVSETFAFRVWVEDGRLRLEDFAAVDLYPTGPDGFYSTSEPWAVSFGRDAEGRVATMAVQFLRRTEEGKKVAAPEYVGSARCGECHRSGEGGAPYVSWLQSRHGFAYWRLATDWARVLASTRPHFQGLTDPQQDSRCLLCHRTGAQDERAIFAKTFHAGEGVGCEACHGPGSLYANAETMATREAFLAAGGRIPDVRTCETCHRDPARFEFATWWPKIAHGQAPAETPDAWIGRGMEALRAGRLQETREAFEKAVAAAGGDPGMKWFYLDQFEARADDAVNETRARPAFAPGTPTGLRGPYFGQAPPDLTPRVFAPGIVSVMDRPDLHVSFSPDGHEMYLTTRTGLLESRESDEGWTAPAPVTDGPMAGLSEVNFSPDGRRMLANRDRQIWALERTPGGWGEPTRLFTDGMFVTEADDRTIYFTRIGADGGHVVHSVFRDGAYQTPEPAGGGVATPAGTAHPAIAPDQSFLVFDSPRAGGQGGFDLWVSYREADGTWGVPVNLGPLVNSKGQNMCATLSADGKYLFFTRFDDIWWVSSEILRRR